MNKWTAAPSMGDLEKEMMAKFDKDEEEEKFRNMSQAERTAVKEEETRMAAVGSRWVQKFDSNWHKKNKKKRKAAKISRRANRK